MAKGLARYARPLVWAGLVMSLVACGPTYRNHGYVPPQEDLDQIVVGIDTRSSVEETLGGSGSGSVLEDDALYFVRSRIRTVAMLEPEVIERNVVAVSFDDNGIVSISQSNICCQNFRRSTVRKITNITSIQCETNIVFTIDV